MNVSRKRYLIASALFEYINNEENKPFEHQRGNNVEDMKRILHTEYPQFIETLLDQKQMKHARLRATIEAVEDDYD